jgi:UDP-glucose:(heptosyl)LPS alpha-1,3-glucosyltransferase
VKIAFVRARYSAHGGAERFAARAIQALARSTAQATDVAVLARRWDANAIEETSPPVRVIRCDPFYLGSTWRDVSFASAVHARLKRERFDLVQSHERIAGLPIYRAGDGVHAAWLERRGRALASGRRFAMTLDPHHRYLARAERAMFEHPDLQAVICNSRMVVDEITTRFAIDADKLVLIRNGVDVDRFHPDAGAIHRRTMRARFGIDDATPTFVLVGSGFERKGVAQAIEALCEIAGAALVIVGADKRLPRYRDQATALGLAGRVHFVGPVTDTLPYLAMSDVFVLPTLYDPFPNAALEAWATGLPIITTDASGAAELVDPRINGWVVDAYDRAPLIAAMRDAATRSASRVASMAEAARQTALPLSLPVLAGELVALYQRLLADR